MESEDQAGFGEGGVGFEVVVLGADKDGELDVHDAGLGEVKLVQVGVGDGQGGDTRVYYQVSHEDADAGNDDGEGDEDADDGGEPD